MRSKKYNKHCSIYAYQPCIYFNTLKTFKEGHYNMPIFDISIKSHHKRSYQYVFTYN
jgi:hypothetical protein